MIAPVGRIRLHPSPRGELALERQFGEFVRQQSVLFSQRARLLGEFVEIASGGIPSIPCANEDPAECHGHQCEQEQDECFCDSQIGKHL